MESKTQVAIIGADIMGIGIARDLAQRGIEFILLERGDLASGASGRNHGYLHSGARYVVNDPKLVSIAFGWRYRCSQSHRFHPQDDLQKDP